MIQPANSWRNPKHVKRQLVILLASILLIAALPAGAPLADAPELPRDAEKLSADQIYQALNKKRIIFKVYREQGRGAGLNFFDFDQGLLWGYVNFNRKSGKPIFKLNRNQVRLEGDQFCVAEKTRKASSQAWTCRDVYHTNDGTFQTDDQGIVTSFYEIHEEYRPLNPGEIEEATIDEIRQFTDGRWFGAVNYSYLEPQVELLYFDWTRGVVSVDRFDSDGRLAKGDRLFRAEDGKICAAFEDAVVTRCSAFKISGDTFYALTSEDGVYVTGTRQ